MSDTERYFVDKRSGCVAVRDRQHESYDSNYQGLHSDTDDVVLYFGGLMMKADDKFKGWTVSPLDVDKCNKVCDKLNRMQAVNDELVEVLEEILFDLPDDCEDAYCKKLRDLLRRAKGDQDCLNKTKGSD
jgi:hypothetical protein